MATDNRPLTLRVLEERTYLAALDALFEKYPALRDNREVPWHDLVLEASKAALEAFSEALEPVRAFRQDTPTQLVRLYKLKVPELKRKRR